jgi:hypothetical protein
VAVVPIATVAPPLNERLLADDGQISQAWIEHIHAVSDQINALQAAKATEDGFWAGLAAGPSYANDAAAAVGLVPVGVPYRNGSNVMVRVV